MNDVAIKVNKVSKNFHYTSGRAGTLKSLITGFWKKGTSVEKDIQHALKGVSFEIKKGEFFGIVGRNGSGKSTLLKMIAGIYQPNAGTIEVHGKLVPFIELGVGFNPELTGRENVYLNGALLGFTRKEVEAQYKEIVEFAELEKFMDQQLKNYSSGMQVRLAFAMAVRAKADILLIDEVLAVGDADFQRKCFDYFKQLKKDKKTVVFISHDMEAVRQYCTDAILIENGKIVVEGTAKQVAKEYSKLFIDRSQYTSEADNGKDNRWGNGNVYTESVSIDVTNESVTINLKIKARQDVDGLTLGFMVRSTDGQRITGTNSRIEDMEIGQMEHGDSRICTWTIPNIFGDGKFIVDVTIHNKEATEIFDWWDDAAFIIIKKKRNLSYSVDPGFELEVNKII